jgi:O-antigen ligase
LGTGIQFWRVDSPVLQKFGMALLFALSIVWQIPHVIVLRHFLILALCALYLPRGVAAIFSRCGDPAADAWRRKMLLIYAALIVWMLIVAIVISDETAASLRDLRGEWVPATVCLAAGLGAGIILSGTTTDKRNLAARAVFWGLILHAVLQLGTAAWLLGRNGALPDHFAGISDHRANVTYTNTLALAMLLAEGIAWAFQKARFLGLNRAALLFTYLTLLLSTFASASRGGMVVFVLLTIIGGVILLFSDEERRRRNHYRLLVGGGLLLLLLGVFFGIKSDPRWQRIVATVPVAWDVDSTKFWVNPYVPGAPKAADGGELEISTYHRVALARVASRYFMEHPLGTDASREAFKRLVTSKYPDAVLGHSHNGYLDFGLATGFPGLGLWMAFLWALAWYGLKRYRETGSPYAMALFLVVAGYALRGFLDSVFREHMLEEFMLCAGLLLGAVDARSKV